MTQCEDVIADNHHETDSEAYLVWIERAPNWGLVLTLICFTHLSQTDLHFFIHALVC